MIHMVSKLTLAGVLLKTRLEVGGTELFHERSQALPWRLGRKKS